MVEKGPSSSLIAVEMGNPGRNQEIINKTMDLEDLKGDQAVVIVDELNSLTKKLRAKNLKISSWYGRFDLTGDPESLRRFSSITS